MTETRLRRAAKLTAFAYLTSVIVVVASERVYWYWTGMTLEGTSVLALFYLLPTLVMLITVAAGRLQRLHEMLLVGAVFAFVVEGVLTPVLYSDGALPVLAALFVGWHGLLSIVGFWYLARRWLLTGDLRTLTGVGALVGVLWGLWATVAALDPPPQPAIGPILSPGAFAVYAFEVGAVLMAAHWLIGFVWPKEWSPSPRTATFVGIAVAVYLAVAVVPTVPWAPMKLMVLVGVTLWVLRQSRTRVGDGHPTVLEALAGRVPARRVSVLVILPASAAVTYAALWQLHLPLPTATAIYWAMVAAVVTAGAAGLVWATRRSLGRTPPASRPTNQTLPLRIP